MNAQVRSRPLAAPDSLPPLVVDLDGTLVTIDVLQESLLRVATTRPWRLPRVFSRLRHGKAAFKQAVAEQVEIDPAHLPYSETFLTWLREQKKHGRELWLVTGSDRRVAKAIADHLGLFDEVLASDGQRNLTGVRKAQVLAERLAERGFVYAGNSWVDVAVWAKAQGAVVVNASWRVRSAAAQTTRVEREFPARSPLRAWLRAVRPHQWAKNLLLFVPLITAHRFFEWPLLLIVAVMFVAFSLCASSVYLLNDLLDLDADRRHPTKKHRPFAAGDLSVVAGLVGTVVLLVAAFALAAMLGWWAMAGLASYYALTVAYSGWWKRVVLVDVIALAVLYITRVIVGGMVVSIPISQWLLGFAGFVFLSLAFTKRYTELRRATERGAEKAHGRGYLTADLPIIGMCGIAAGFAAVLVLTLYVNSEAVLKLYSSPLLLWLWVPIILYWLCRVWLMAHRGELDDDPVVFAARDPTTYALAAVVVTILIVAAWVPPTAFPPVIR
ncbi:MAG: UbiA family prenyltransferase [Gemmataceae bacterium]|nr:UbiA family prenyltransferase [Gemmata sp.]MDW8199128.1 UbiA family prenyltransferase [Gemmataceae bacterium]